LVKPGGINHATFEAVENENFFLTNSIVECGICQHGKTKEKYTELKRVEHSLKKIVQEQSKHLYAQRSDR
jgi:hypothetical protein